MKIQLFIPCFIDQLYPKTAQNTLEILERVGCEVAYNPEQTCCGQPSFNSGYWKETRQLAEKFFADFSLETPIVSPSGSCSGFIKKHYHKLFAGDAAMLEKCEKLSANIFELSDFLVNKLKIENVGAKFPHKVTFHESCSALREYGIKEEPFRLLRNVEGLELVEMDESTTCCGFGGTFSVKFTDISSAMVEKKVRNALATGAEFIVSTEASCLMNINGYLQKHNLPMKGVHLADVLNSDY